MQKSSSGVSLPSHSFFFFLAASSWPGYPLPGGTKTSVQMLTKTVFVFPGVHLGL